MRNRKPVRKLLIGVTGGIGAGKSLVCEYFKELGSKIFYADKIARDLYVSDIELKKKLVNVFGNQIIDEYKQLNLLKFREVVFKNDKNQRRVNKIVHPFVIDEILKRTLYSKSNLVFIEAALIFESGFDKYLDYTVEIFTSVKKRIQRVRERSNLNARIIRSIMKLQMTESEKVLKADFVLKNDSTKKELKKKVIFLFELLKRISSFN